MPESIGELFDHSPGAVDPTSIKGFDFISRRVVMMVPTSCVPQHLLGRQL